MQSLLLYQVHERNVHYKGYVETRIAEAVKHALISLSLSLSLSLSHSLQNSLPSCLMFQQINVKLFTVWYVGNPVGSLCAQ